MKRTRTIWAALCLAFGVLSVLPPASAHAVDDYPVVVKVTSVTPTQLQAGQAATVEVSGTLTNTSSFPLTWVTAELWRDPTPATTPERLTELTAADPGDVPGSRLRDEAGGTMVTVRRGEPLNPGASEAFTLRATTEQLGFTAAGVYSLGVHVRALPPAGPVATVGIDRWVMPLAPAEVAYAAVTLLTSKPSMTAIGEFTDGHLAAELTGRLDRLLQFAERPGATFAIDPGLVDEVRALTANHVVNGKPAGPVPAASAWLSRLTALIRRGHGFRLPYANPNLREGFIFDNPEAVARVLVRTQEAAAASGNPASALPLAVLGGSGEFAASLSPSAVVISPSCTGHTGELVGATPLPLATLRPLSFIPDRVRQHVRAEEVVGALSGRPMVRIVSSEADVAGVTALGAEGRTLTPLTDLPRTPDGACDATTPTVTDKDLADRLRTWIGAIPFALELSGPDFEARVARISANAMSQNLSAAEALAYLGDAARFLPDENQLLLRSQPSVVMAARDNQFPLSVSNRSASPVRVKVTFTSSNPQRVRVADTQVVELSAGETTSINAEVHATSNGVVDVTAQLSTESGRRLGDTQSIEIVSTEAGLIGWVIIVASAVLVIGGTVWRIRAVQREAAAKGVPSES
ncbi:MAG: DUF6049 family protein [Propionibacteriaceae bacterium]|nr:DUF6049 family protein [Propionibacteriaceae bacterium]